MSKTTADLLKEIERWRDNARETWSAMNAMRDAINEFVPMPGLDSDLLQGPDNGVFCETVANAVIMQIQALSDEIATLTVARDAQNDIIERCAAVVDQCNRDGPYNAIIAGQRIRALKNRT